MLGRGLESLIPNNTDDERGVGSQHSTQQDSFDSGLLREPQFVSSDSRPAVLRDGMDSNADFVFLHSEDFDAEPLISPSVDSFPSSANVDFVTTSTPVAGGDFSPIARDVSSPSINPTFSVALTSAPVVQPQHAQPQSDPDADSLDLVSTQSTPAQSGPIGGDVKKKTELPNPKFPDAIFHIEVDKIRPNPFQPRRYFDDDAISDLAASIREYGILQPLVVTKVVKENSTGTDVEYQLIAGERRLLASKKLGLERVPAIVKNVDVERERLELAIIENLQRENLNAVEMARAFARLQDEFRLTQREIATRLGKSREVVANTLRLLDLPPMIQKAIEENKITESHGRVLLGIADVGAQQRLFYELLSKPLTIRELKAKMKGMEGGESVSVAQGFVQGRMQPRLKLFEDRLSADLGAPVKISQHGESGRIVINYYSKEELEQILQKLRLQEEEG